MRDDLEMIIEALKDDSEPGYTLDDVKEKKAAILAALPDAIFDATADYGYKLGCARGRKAVIVCQPYRPENGQEFINLTVEQVVAALRD